jgi:hypothetical protein
MAVLASASCSGSPAPKRSQYDVVSARRHQLIPLIVQCFIDRHLLTARDLQDPQVSPPDPSSAWLRNGRIIRNTAFANWYADKGSGIAVKGTLVDDWVTDAAYDPAYWPASICGPRPHVTPTAPAYPPPGI